MIAEIFVLVSIFGFKDVLGQGMGPLNINLMTINPCDGNTGAVKLSLVSLGNDKKGIDMDFDLPFDLDGTVSYVATVDKIEGGERQKGVFRHDGANACTDFAQFLGKVWSKASEAVGFNADCPKPAGHYQTNAFEFNYKDLDIESFMYGRFILTLQLLLAGDLVVCHEIEFTNDRPGF